jgi:hypothetical protein
MKTIEVILHRPHAKPVPKHLQRAAKTALEAEQAEDIKALIEATKIDGSVMTESTANLAIIDLYSNEGQLVLHMSAERYGCFMVNRHAITTKYSWQVKSSKFIEQKRVFDLDY